MVLDGLVNICCVKGCQRGWVAGKFHSFTIKLKSTSILGEWMNFEIKDFL